MGLYLVWQLKTLKNIENQLNNTNITQDYGVQPKITELTRILPKGRTNKETQLGFLLY